MFKNKDDINIIKEKLSSLSFPVNVTYRVLRALLVFTIFALIALGTMGLGIGVGYFSSLVSTLDVPSKETLETKIYDIERQSKMTYDDGSLISVIKSDLVRTPVDEKSISPLIKKALIYTEDEYFYEHNGIVPKALARATISDVTGLGGGSGGSTITQQLIKQQILTNETSYTRKASEILLALHTEKFFSKTEILNAYLNVSPFGRNNKGENIAGIEEAANGIFGLKSSEVNLPQAAFLAGLPQSPIEYSPYNNDGSLKEKFDSGFARKDNVLFNLYREKQISKKEYEEAKSYDLVKDFLQPEKGQNAENSFLYHQLYDEAARIMMVPLYEADKKSKDEVYKSQELFEHYFDLAKRDIRQEGYTIESTINKNIHNAMEEAVQQFGYILDDGRPLLLETGSILMDNKTGRIYGFIGGRDYQQNQNNHAFQRRRSPGSTMKPILAYAPAIDQGLIGSETRLADFPMNYKHGGTPVKNYSDFGSNSFKTTRDALKWSLNIPVVNLYSEMQGKVDPKAYFDKMEIGLNPEEYGRESIPLGGTDEGLTVFEETGAYATLANKGTYNRGYTINKIKDKSGKVVYEHKSNPVQVFKPATASIMNDLMRDVLDSGTGQAAKEAFRGSNLAKADWVGKTGTSENQRDYWFTASTPSITMSSWIGYDDNTEMYDTWNKQNMVYWSYMTNYVYQRSPEIFGENEKFTIDPSVKKVKVSEFTGQKEGPVKVDGGSTVNLRGSKTVTSLYSGDYAKDSTFRFGIGGTDSQYQNAWRNFGRGGSSSTEKPKTNDSNKKKPKETKKDDEEDDEETDD